MTKDALANAVVIKTGMVKSEAIAAVEAVFDSMADCFVKGSNLYIRGFATFEVKVSAPKPARNINKGETVYIPARRTVKLKLSQKLKDKLNK